MWFLYRPILEKIEQAELNHQPAADVVASFQKMDRTGQRITTRSGGTVSIDVRGVLTKAPNIFAQIFCGGNTTYSEIEEAVKAAEADEGVGEIRLVIDSGGGSVAGMFGAMVTIRDAKTPTVAVIDELAASAAYALASQADRIEASVPTATVGSVGVVQSYYVDDSVVDVTSSNAPNKRPDVTTEEGKAAVRSYLDQIEGEMIAAIAKGRKVDPEKVKNDFGRGGLVIAKVGVDRGMVDAIIDHPTTDKRGRSAQGDKKMDEATMKAEHPALYAAVVKAGAEAERERVSAHLTMGKRGGDAGMKLAMDNIEAGADFGPLVQAKYMDAALGRSESEARSADETIATVEPAESTSDVESDVHAAALAEMGVE